LVGFLNSPSHVWRLQALRMLLRRKPSSATATALEKLALGNSSQPVRVAALFTLKQLLRSDAHEAIIRIARESSMREFCLRALADRTSELANVPSGVFTEALRDSDPRVRLQAAIGLARLGKSEIAENLIAATEDRDPLVSHAAVNSLVSLKAVNACLSALDYRKTAWNGAIQALQRLHERATVDGLIDRLRKTDSTELRRLILTALCRLQNREAEYTGNWWGTRPDTTGPYFKAVDWAETARVSDVLSTSLRESDDSTKKFLLGQMARHRVQTEETVPLILKFAQEDKDFVPSAITLLTRRSAVAPEAIALFARVATSSDFSQPTRARAISALQRSSEPQAFQAAAEALVSVPSDRQAGEEMTRAREQFVRDPRNARAISDFVAMAADPNSGRRELGYAVLAHVATQRQASRDARDTAAAAFESAWSRSEDLGMLLKIVGQTRADRFASQVRAHLNDSDAQVRKQAQYAARELKLDQQSGTVLEKLAYETVLSDAQRDKGDAKFGQALFVRQGCVACHTMTASEPVKGPFLGDVANRYGRAELIESILRPNAKIAQGFVGHWVETADQDRYEGFIVRESGDEIELRNAAGIAVTVPLKTVRSRGKLDKSIMPEGLVNNLTVHEFASLLAYFESLKTK
jgi:putative heme-binding domain-containing protein